ncbi:MAG: FHA domain-containing protein [Mogibacterium sp.]|nr:FHA domain-containing protein [Mogibacterium sp.]
MAWIISGIIIVAAFALVAYLVSNKISAGKSPQGGSHPGYQDIIVKNVVDVREQKYISSTGQHFPNVGGIQSTPTILTDDHLNHNNLVLYDVTSRRQHNCQFNRSLIIGRNPETRAGDSRLVINDNLLSKSHCRVERDGQKLIIRDLQSRNGTFLNGKRILKTATLNSGDRIDIGGSAFIVRL